MSKSSNKQQLQHLLTLMQENPGIARGFFKGERQEVQRFWQRAEDELNSLGPPSKNFTEWKKVWSDQKKYVRQKASQNLQHQKGTGGGPNREYKFSATEESIYNLIAMKTSVEGVPGNVFGLGSPKNFEDPLNITLDSVCVDVSMTEPNQNVSVEGAPASKTTRMSNSSSKIKANVSKENVRSSYDILQAELAVQNDLVGTLKEVVVDVKEQQQSLKKIYRSIDKMYDLKKKHFQQMANIEKEKLQEMRRHHSFMEKMRTREVQYKLDKNNLQLQFNDLSYKPS